MCCDLMLNKIIAKKKKNQKIILPEPDELFTSCVPMISFYLLMPKNVRESALWVEISSPFCTIE